MIWFDLIWYGMICLVWYDTYHFVSAVLCKKTHTEGKLTTLGFFNMFPQGTILFWWRRFLLMYDNFWIPSSSIVKLYGLLSFLIKPIQSKVGRLEGWSVAALHVLWIYSITLLHAKCSRFWYSLKNIFKQQVPAISTPEPLIGFAWYLQFGFMLDEKFGPWNTNLNWRFQLVNFAKMLGQWMLFFSGIQVIQVIPSGIENSSLRQVHQSNSRESFQNHNLGKSQMSPPISSQEMWSIRALWWTPALTPMHPCGKWQPLDCAKESNNPHVVKLEGFNHKIGSI